MDNSLVHVKWGEGGPKKYKTGRLIQCVVIPAYNDLWGFKNPRIVAIVKTDSSKAIIQINLEYLTQVGSDDNITND